MFHLELVGLQFHHAGCLTTGIEVSCDRFCALSPDFQASEIYEITAQKVRVCFVGPPSGPFVEFVEPMGDAGSLAAMLRKGKRFYHTGYFCRDIEASSRHLQANGWRQINHFISGAFAGALCAFFVDEDGLLIELIERRS